MKSFKKFLKKTNSYFSFSILLVVTVVIAILVDYLVKLSSQIDFDISKDDQNLINQQQDKGQGAFTEVITQKLPRKFPDASFEPDNIMYEVRSFDDPFPEIDDYEKFLEIYDYPRVFIFENTPQISNDLEKFESDFGMTGYYDDDFVAYPWGDKGNYYFGEKDMLTKANFIQYRDFANSTDEEDFRITFYKEECNPEQELEWVIKREIIMTRIMKTWGENEDFYLYGRMKLDTDKWVEAWIYFMILDDDGEPDEETIYVIDYLLLDEFDRKYKLTLRAKKDYLIDNYQRIAELISGFDSQENYQAFMMTACYWESYDHYKNRLDYHIYLMQKICDFENDGECPYNYELPLNRSSVYPQKINK